MSEPEPDEPLFEGWELNVIRNMDDPPAEAYETSWRHAKDILEELGPSGGFILVTVTMDDEDLDSRVVLSSGYQRIPSSYIREVLNVHLGDAGLGDL